MEVNFRVYENILIACVKGEVDHHSAAPLRHTIDESMQIFGLDNLVMDFSGVDFMDSSGIGVILGRYKRIRKSSGSFCISGCSGYIEKLLEMSGVLSLIPAAEDYESAADIINGRQQICLEV